MYRSKYTHYRKVLQELFGFFFEISGFIFEGGKNRKRKGFLFFIGEILCCGLHRISEILLTLGRGDREWNDWYNFFQLGSFKEEKAGEKLLKKILEAEKGKTGPIVFLTDGVNIFRSTGSFPGVIIQRAPDTIRWKRGFRYCQRFLHTAYLAQGQENGYCEAIPLRFLPAFGRNAKNLPEGLEPKTPHQAALECAHWLRSQVSRFGYAKRPVVMVGDGGFDQNAIWKNLPKGVVWLARTKRNRSLFHPAKKVKNQGRGRPKVYGEKAKKPHEYTRTRKDYKTWERVIRGKKRKVKYKVKGPFFIEGNPNQAVFLLVIAGGNYQVGKRVKYRKPAFFLVNGVKNGNGWELPLPEEDLVYFQWQRWEIEVSHRDMKSGFGLGDKQCWNPKSSVQTVQWNAWVYGVLKWFGYKNRKLLKEPAMIGKWYRHRRRWSIQMLLQCYQIGRASCRERV